MNVVEIEKLINEIGDVDFKINKQNLECLLGGKNIVIINQNYLEELQHNFNQKLKNQLRQNGDVKLLEAFLESISALIENLSIILHKFRTKLAQSITSTQEFSRIYKKICQLIISKIGILEKMKNDLIPIIKNFDYKLDSDFNTSISQNSEIPSEDEESEVDILTDRIDNPFPNIFRNYDAYLFFERLKENICTDQTTQLADYSYVYRKMLEDKFINDEVSPSSFVSFLDKNYNIVLDPLKSWGKLTGKHRVMLYEILKTKSS
jgi:hypothetical protein